jgi:type IV pilus assembly protein PilA
MGERLRRRLRADESGVTLLELLVVVTIMGILLAIAIPSYLGFQGRAESTKAKANVRTVLPAIEGYYADHLDYAFDTKADGTPAADVADALQSYGSGISFSGPHAVTVASVGGGTSYCVSAASGSTFWKKSGPDGAVLESATGC